MNQAERDRLLTLKKVQKRLITQREAAAELSVSVRHVKRLMKALKSRGDKVVVHGLRGKSSKRRLAAVTQQEAIGILRGDIYRGFGPTLASEYLAKRHQIQVSRETLRKWMSEAGLWKGCKQKVEKAHVWRQRRSRHGELVQWDTSDHDWLEGRGKRIYLITMIDDATSRLYGRFVRSDSTQENMLTAAGYLLLYGRPLAFYTDKAALFHTAEKRRRDEPGVEKDGVEMPPTQIGRALRELEINWIGAHSPQAKGRVERGFSTAQDRLVKGMRVAGVTTLEEANEYLEKEFLPWWNKTLTVEADNAENAHRQLEKRFDLAAILSHVETRKVSNDYTIQHEAHRYQIERKSICLGLRGSAVRVEKRMDGSIAIRFGERYLKVTLCETARPALVVTAKVSRPGKAPNAGGKSKWMKNFWQTPAPPLWEAIQRANATS